jgi:Fe-S oxidoreductase
VAAALDLCVSCKGCKRDCPTGVDMARMKIEVTAQRRKRFGASLKDKLLADLPNQVHRAARVPGLAALLNLRNASPLLRRMAERRLGIAAARTLPRFRRDTFWRSSVLLGVHGQGGRAHGIVDAAAALQAARAGQQVAVLFVDTFNGGFETENALAAVRVLRAAGYLLHVPQKPGGHHCCGRTHLAAGDVDAARASLSALMDAVLPLAEAGVAIVGLEPSCLLTLRDEALALHLGEKATVVAAQALLFEEFIARELQAGRFALQLKPLGKQLLLHGHCHQKAFGAVAPILQVLKLIPGAQPELIESSCCGMAGSFGYEARHQAVSQQMAEATLLPAIRRAPDAVVVADGTSCRAQIAHGAQRDAQHVALLLASLLQVAS